MRSNERRGRGGAPGRTGSPTCGRGAVDARETAEAAHPDVLPVLPGGASPLVGWEPELDPMLGQFLVEPDDDEPGALLDGVVPDEAEDPSVDVVPDDVVPDEVPELVLDVLPLLVAALATSAPPATRPLVRAPTASALRSRSFMMFVPR